MAAGHEVPEDDSTLSWLDRSYFRLETLLDLLSGLTILGIMFLAVVNILGRKLFDLPVPGFVDWMEQAVPLIAFLGIAYCQRLGGHIRMDILIGRLRGRALHLAEAAGVTLMLALSLVLVWGSWLHFRRSFAWDAPLWSRDSTIDINLPIWPVKLMVPVILTIFSIRLVLQLWAYLRAALRGDEIAVAVPMIQSAAEIAEHEAETLSGADDAEGTPEDERA